MIKKEITMNDGKTYIVGFKEVGSNKDGIECHVLEKGFLFEKSVYHKLRLKGLKPDYHQMAVLTILDYQRDCKQKETLLQVSWSH